MNLFHGIARQVKLTARPVDTRRAHAWVSHWLIVARTAYHRGDRAGLSRALARAGSSEYDGMFFFADGHLGTEIDEGKFAQELGRLQIAHILGDMRDELKRATCDEEKAAIHARTGGWPSGARRAGAFPT